MLVKCLDVKFTGFFAGFDPGKFFLNQWFLHKGQKN